MCLPIDEEGKVPSYCILHTHGVGLIVSPLYFEPDGGDGERLGGLYHDYTSWLNAWMLYFSAADMSVHMRNVHLDARGAMTTYIEADNVQAVAKKLGDFELPRFRDEKYREVVRTVTQIADGRVRVEFSAPLQDKKILESESKEEGEGALDTNFVLRFEIYSPGAFKLSVPEVLPATAAEVVEHEQAQARAETALRADLAETHGLESRPDHVGVVPPVPTA